MSSSLLQRDAFASKIGIVAAAAGSAVGLGNIWKFPYMVGNNGGSAFILVYILATILIGYPLACTELAMGRKARANTVDTFGTIGKNRFWAWVGGLPVVSMYLIMAFYTMIAGWVAWYVILAFDGGMWNLPENVEAGVHYANVFTNMTASVPISLTCAFALLVVVCFVNSKGIKSGIEASAKILMPILFFLILGLIIYSMTLSGFGQACKYMFAPDLKAFSPSVVLAAIGQAFLSLSLGMGILTTYGSYIDEKQDLRSIVRQMIVADTVIAILAGLVIFPAVFTYGLEPSAGPSLIFMSLPQVFLKMPMGWLVAGVFFLLILIAALTSMISLFEISVTFLSERTKLSRANVCILVATAIFGGTVLCVLSQRPDTTFLVFKGKTMLDIFDYATNNITLPLAGAFICILAGWVWKIQNLEAELKTGSNKPLSLVDRFLFEVFLKWITAPMILFLMAAWIYESFQ